MATNSELFQMAHRIAKSIHIEGDCYYITFGSAIRIALKAIANIKAGDTKTITPALVAAMLHVVKLDVVANCIVNGVAVPAPFVCKSVVHMANICRSLLTLETMQNIVLVVSYDDNTTLTFNVVGE